MARKKRAARRRSPIAKRTKKKAKKNTREAESKRTQSRTLIAILALFLFLHLIDEETFDSVTSTMKPRKKHTKKRRGRNQGRVVREKKTRLSSKSRHAKPRQ